MLDSLFPGNNQNIMILSFFHSHESLFAISFFCKNLLMRMGYSRKNLHLPDEWDSGNSHRRGGQRLWKSRREGGLNLRKSSARVIFTDSSRDSNV